jgi:hypothetical protein
MKLILAVLLIRTVPVPSIVDHGPTRKLILAMLLKGTHLVKTACPDVDVRQK